MEMLDKEFSIQELIDFALKYDKGNGSYLESRWQGLDVIYSLLEENSGLTQEEISALILAHRKALGEKEEW
jgi:hypothetical protein